MPQAEGLEDLPDSSKAALPHSREDDLPHSRKDDLPDPREPDVGDSGGSRAISGQRLILRMFVVLAVATVAILLFFSTQVEAQYRPRIYGALVLNLVLVVVVYYLLKVIGKR